MDPKPVQKPHIPLIVGGFSPPAMRRAVRVGAGWLGFGMNPEVTKQAIAGFETALAAAGRTRESFEIIITPGSVDADVVREFRDLGVDRLVPLMNASSPEAVNQRFRELEEFAKIVA
jgi:alkanesulfonate monooxygenase SsuD/methylene tetrahydromethanopterin reductase-like flavin-dependent oxidoreductase (luciferase family)